MLRNIILTVMLGIFLLGLFYFQQNNVNEVSLNPVERETMTVTDLAGRQVTLSHPANRIVLMRSLCLPELAVILGDEIESKLVGWDSSLKTGDRDTYDMFTEQFPRLREVPEIGDVLRDTVSPEAIIALKPDLVIVNTYMLERGTKSLNRLQEAGLPLLYLNFDDPFRDPQNSIRLLGQVFDKKERAEALVSWVDKKFAKVRDRLKEIHGPSPSIYLEAGTQGPNAYGNTFGSNPQQRAVNWSSMLEQLRCQNIAANSVSGLYGMGVIQPEYLLTANPQVIVITGADWTSFPSSLKLGYDADPQKAKECLRSFLSRPGWEHLSAVRNRRVHGIQTRFGSHITSFVAAEQLAQWLYPDEFRDLQPEADLREFHRKFMPIQYRGTWMVSLDSDQ